MGALEGGFFILQNIIQGGDAVATAWVVESEGGGMRVGGGRGWWWGLRKNEKWRAGGRNDKCKGGGILQ